MLNTTIQTDLTPMLSAPTDESVDGEARNPPALQHSQPSVKPRSLGKNHGACN